MSRFLDDDELEKLTGFKLKSKQIEHLRKEGIPFRVNGTGHPVVLWSDLDGNQVKADLDLWKPAALA